MFSVNGGMGVGVIEVLSFSSGMDFI